MKNYLFILLFMVTGTLLLSCGGVPIMTAPSQNNDTYTVDYLFEHDGCKVYRFYDQGNYVYFTNCNGDVTSLANDSTRTITITRSTKIVK